MLNVQRLSTFKVALESVGRRNFAYNTKLKSKGTESHYDVLNLHSDCTKQDIRDAFVKLSKQYHPDMKDNGATTDRTARFLRITEAYQTLVKTSTRREYDYSLTWHPAVKDAPNHTWEIRPNYDPNPGPYYGINGLHRVSNWKIVLFLMSLGIFGAIFGYSSAKHSFNVSRQIQDEISAEASNHHAAVVADAQKYGNKEQIRRMVERLARDPLGGPAAK